VQREIFYAKSLTLKGLSGASAKAFVDYWWKNATQLTSRGWWFQLDVSSFCSFTPGSSPVLTKAPL